MLLKLLKLDWQGFRRAPYWGQSMAINIIMGFFAAYMLLLALSVGFLGGYMLEEFFPDANVIDKFNGFFVYYLLLDLIMRFMLQKFPSFAVSKYLTLNIGKSTLTKYMLTKSLLSFFNILPLFVIIPFFFTNVLGSVGIGKGLMWLVLMLVLVLINNYKSFWLDRSLDKQPILVFGILAMVSGLIYLEYKQIFMLSEYASDVMAYLYKTPLVFIPVVILGALYAMLYKGLKGSAYLDTDLAANGTKVSEGLEFAFLDNFGEAGKWMRLETKLIWRNKKSRNYLFMSFIFLVYPFIMGMDWISNVYLMLVFGMLMVGGFMLNYGQLLFSWNSSHFDFITTQNLSLYNFLKSKYLLIALSNIFFFVLSTPYIFLNPKIVFVNFVMMFFNAGVIAFFYLWFTMNNSKKMSLEKGNVFNQEGISASHYFIMIPIVALPYVVFVPFKLMGYENLGLIALGLIGLIGVVFHERLLKKAIKTFNYKKYFLHQNFSR